MHKIKLGLMAIWGPMKSGKTLAGLGSPFTPITIIDTEDSSLDYHNHKDRLIKDGVLKNDFTRVDAKTRAAAFEAIKVISSGPFVGGTLIIDTGGQLTTWIAEWVFEKNPTKADKMSQVVWGEVRNFLREKTLLLASKVDLLIYTAHQREYKGISSPRMNPAIMELASFEIRLQKPPNALIPNAIVRARLPFFPPQISEFTIQKLLSYMDKPADYGNLTPDEIAVEPAIVDTGEEDAEQEHI